MLFEVLALLIAFVALYKLIFGLQEAKQEKPKNAPPNNLGIPGLAPSDPIEGNNEDVKKAGTMSVFLIEMHKKYGDIFSFWQGKNLTVSIASPELFKGIRHLFEIPMHVFEQFLILSGPDTYFTKPVDEIKSRRKMFDQHFMMKACRSYANCFLQVANEAIDKWKKLGANKTIDLISEMSFMSMSALSQTSFGDYFKKADNIEEYQDLIKFVFANLDPPPQEGTGIYNEVVDKSNRLLDIVRKILEERRELKKSGKLDDEDSQLLIDTFLEDDSMTDAERIGDASIFISAGYTTTAMVMAWLIYYLSLYPEIQEKVYEELVKELGDKPISLEDVPKLRYFRQVVDETLRINSKYQYGARKADENMKLGDYTVPKDTCIYQAVGVLFLSPKVFPNPEKFDPDRFKPENTRGRHAYAFKPFGYAGKRVCPGQVFANTEMAMFLAQWLRQFRFTLVPGQNIELLANLSAMPNKENMFVNIESRN